ncbi:MAG: VOC family protein [Candidatus Limnocylindrales bacterium]
MARIVGVGGVFFMSQDRDALNGWYHDVLGLEIEDWGGVFFRPGPMAEQPGAGTVFTAFAADSTYFAPSTREFMINLAVDDLDGILARCAEHGVEVLLRFDGENGRFAHIVDLDGTKIELWQPLAPPD